jgi:2-keto-4-pentenoate hydratase
MTTLETLANSFFGAFYDLSWPTTLSQSVSQLSLSEAYKVQDLVAQKRIENGEELAGFKVGCTSTAIRRQLSLSEPISARMFRPHILGEGTHLKPSDYLNCAIEPEMVLRIGRDLYEEGLTDQQLIKAIDYVSAGIEVHNFKFWFQPPSSQELICSGGLLADLVVGPEKVSPQELSFSKELFRVYLNGQLIEHKPASEIMGGPLTSLRWLVNSLVMRGTVLKEGSLVIPGSPVELIPITNNTNVKVAIEGIGTVTASFND